MAHPCDYASQTDLSKLRKSPSGMNPTSTSTTRIRATISNVRIKGDKDFSHVDVNSNSYILISNFIRENPTWAIESAYNYCIKYYAEFGATKEIFAKALHDYIISK